MFSKISRYKKLDDLVTTDAHGRSPVAKTIRLLPEVSGRFRHTLLEIDRLDHLAFKYYKQPRKWWRICDANSFISPRALMGNEPIVTARFPVTYDAPGHPPWWALLDSLAQTVGVKDVSLEETSRLVETEEKEENCRDEIIEWTVIISFNRLNISVTDLEDKIKENGFETGESSVTGRVGKAIVIPPDVVG